MSKGTKVLVREPIIEGDITKIPLTRGMMCVIDTKNLHLVSGVNWFSEKRQNTSYAARNLNGRLIRMHRLIMGSPEGMLVDHIDMDGLNNTETNIRVATKSQNMKNRGKQTNNKSGLKGVSWAKSVNMWKAQISIGGVNTHLGYFSCMNDAYNKYKEFSIIHHKEFSIYTS